MRIEAMHAILINFAFAEQAPPLTLRSCLFGMKSLDFMHKLRSINTKFEVLSRTLRTQNANVRAGPSVWIS